MTEYARSFPFPWLTVKPKAKGQKAEDPQRFYGRTQLPQDTATLSMLVVQMFPLNIFQRYTKAARQRNGTNISCVPNIVIPKTLTSYIHDPTNRPFIYASSCNSSRNSRIYFNPEGSCIA